MVKRNSKAANTNRKQRGRRPVQRNDPDSSDMDSSDGVPDLQNREESSSDSGSDTMPPLQRRAGDDDSSDSGDSSSEDEMPALRNRETYDESSSDDNSSSDDDVPQLVDRANSESSDDDSSRDDRYSNVRRAPKVSASRTNPKSDDDSSDESDSSMPNLMTRDIGDSSSDNDSDSDSDSSGAPPAVKPRGIRYSSSDDDSSDDSDHVTRSPQRQRATAPSFAPGFLLGKKAKESEKKKSLKKKEADEKQRKKSQEKKELERRAAEKKRQEVERKRQAAEKKRQVAEKKRQEAERKRQEAELILKKRRNEASVIITKNMNGHVARQKYKRAVQEVIRIQTLFRGYRGRTHHNGFVTHMQQFRAFRKVWFDCIKLLDAIDIDEPDWGALRDKQAYIRQQDVDSDEQNEMKETDERLTNSMVDAMNTIEKRTLDDDIEELNGLPTKRIANLKSANGSASASVPVKFKRIHLSGDVVKWLRNGDRKYRDFFIRRMKQLSGGERSRILAKRLNGSTTAKVPIYETYLEQKSGFRILWTERDDYLLVWYVAKHKSVSRLMRLIDDSKSRSDRQRMSIDEISELNDDFPADRDDEHEIFLDPLGNVPLKVYDIGTEDIDKIAKEDWTPALHLTEEERDVVETVGSVLLLGRSGTGKTICICNRMEFDRQKFVKDESFSQLFVARSPRLCTYVKTNIGEYRGCEFATFSQILDEIETQLPKVHSIRDEFPETHFMSFSTFKQEVYNGDKGVDALIVWTNIRSFLKGSIEAMQNSNFVVSKEDYLSNDHFGKKRCRLPIEHREIAYEIFLKYQKKVSELDLWDNCDRIIALIQRLLAAKTSHPEIFGGIESWCKWSKIYVDEVQDYTQAEILLFFHLSGAGNLFLAGDPAQNVTKGVEFRFDDIRSVGYYIAGDNRHLVPQKPKTVNVNFRSHAGILNTAAAILSQMFSVFPDSAKNLGKDDGLFQGPRPGVIHKAKPETMAALLAQKMQGTVVLTHDDHVEDCKKKLGGYELVYGIRRAKGLEFKSVIVMDFFSALRSDLQKPWREMLLGRSEYDFKSTYPEIEGQLKLLYTAVTRCIDRLFFAETAESISGNAFVRWMTTKSVNRDNPDTQPIATMNKMGDIDNMTMTQDEVSISLMIFHYISLHTPTCCLI